jgi:hypothetical protein
MLSRRNFLQSLAALLLIQFTNINSSAVLGRKPVAKILIN